MLTTSANGSSGRTLREAAISRGPAASLAVLAALGIAGGDLAAQQIDAGRLALREGGQRVAIESYRVWEAGANLNSVAAIEPSGNRGGDFQVGISLDARFRGQEYRLRGPDGRALDGVWAVDRVRIHTVTEEGERWRELPSRGPSTVLEEGVAHHYLLLIHVLRESGGRATAVVPLRGVTVTTELVGQQDSQVTLDDLSIAATRYDLRVDGAERRVWIDADGRLLRVLDPASGREAIRLPER